MTATIPQLGTPERLIYELRKAEGIQNATIATLTRQLEAAKGALERSAKKIEGQHKASLGYLLEERPRALPNMPSLAEITLSHFLDIARDMREALATLSTPAEKPDDRRHGIYDMPDGSRWNSGTGETASARRAAAMQRVADDYAMECDAPQAVETGEPVAWRWRRAGQEWWDFCDERIIAENLPIDCEVQPLYAASPATTAPAQDDARRQATDGGAS